MAHRFEIHMHTKEASSCSHISANESIPALFTAGYEGCIITDHINSHAVRARYGEDIWSHPERQTEAMWQEFIDSILIGYKTAKIAAEQYHMTVLLGTEIRAEGTNNDYLVFGDVELFLRKNPFILLKTPGEIAKLAKECNMFIAQAHPFRDPCKPIEDVILDGMEVFNANPRHLHHAHNDMGFTYATEHGFLPLVGSDYHDEHDEGLTWVNFWDDICNTDQLIQALRARRYDCVLCPKVKE